VEKFCKDLNKTSLTLSSAAIEDLTAYPWPGNVRELQNCIERAVILADGDAILQRHLNLSFRNAPPAQVQIDPWDQIDLSGTMADAMRKVGSEVERRKIESALKEAGGNKAQAAHALQIGFKVLIQKVKSYGIPEA
jgi:DNA-binding NtrC family response regulator